MLDKNGIAKRIAKEVKDGYYVNLGIGIRRQTDHNHTPWSLIFRLCNELWNDSGATCRPDHFGGHGSR